MNEKLKLTKLEKSILVFVNKKTWNSKNPKKNKSARVKIGWVKIKTFVECNVGFDNALKFLKLRGLITSRSECQKRPGLTCTKKGHNLVRRNFM